jgi:hypothetical protein
LPLFAQSGPLECKLAIDGFQMIKFVQMPPDCNNSFSFATHYNNYKKGNSWAGYYLYWEPLAGT